jgi:Tfp pilus assembly protein PilO
MDNLIARIAKFPLPQRIAVMVLVLLLLLVGTYFLAVEPLDVKIVQHDSQIARLDTELVKKKAIARDLTRYRVEVERLKQRLNEALTLLPNEAEIPELLQKLASLVQQSDWS